MNCINEKKSNIKNKDYFYIYHHFTVSYTVSFYRCILLCTAECYIKKQNLCLVTHRYIFLIISDLRLTHEIFFQFFKKEFCVTLVKFF